jgi:polyphosphate kinase
MEPESPSPQIPEPLVAPVVVDALRSAPVGRDRYLNRELSWLDNNERVLDLAARRSLPLLERTKFLAIFSSNLDEFFQVRVGSLKVQLQAGLPIVGPEEIGPRERLTAISERVRLLLDKQATIFAAHVEDLAAAGIRLSDWDQLDADDRAFLGESFEERVLPVLTPLAVDPARPFPYISNLSLNLAVAVRAPGDLTRRIARVKVPPLLPRFLVTQDGERFVPLEQLIARRLPSLFPGMDVVGCSPFRVTRNTDYDIELDGKADMVAAVESVLLRRRRSKIVVRLEIESSMSEETSSLLIEELGLGPDDVYRLDGPLGLDGLWSIVNLDRPELKRAPWTPVTQASLVAAKDASEPDLFAVIREEDVLVQHPYDSFETSVEAFIDQAADDPSVLAIKQTLYRTSTHDPGITESLIRAATAGKQVVCVVELKARFDEEANIGWAQRLEDAGVHVTYGVVGLKTHAKLCLVVRDEDDGIRRYAHIGTGNYHLETARMYEDVGLLTADPQITAHVAEVFHLLTGYSRQHDFGSILVAPDGMRDGVVDLIQGQAHPGGRITIKCNNLEDHAVIDALYEASRAGAEVDLILRSICCIRPGIADFSDHVRVRSLVGRYLEHSRILRFGSGDDGTYLIGSADLMQRNLDRRVEVLVPVFASNLRGRIDEILDLVLADTLFASRLRSDGTWERAVGNGEAVDAQSELEQRALARTRRISAVRPADA